MGLAAASFVTSTNCRRQIAAHNLPGKDEPALHRIIGGGDQLVGRVMLHIPQGDVWLGTLTSPPVLGLLAFALLAGGGAATTRHRRKRRKSAMSCPTNTPSDAGADQMAPEPQEHLVEGQGP